MKVSFPQLATQAAATAAVRAREKLRSPTFRERLLETARYLTTTEVHTYAFSVAANAILSFFPFMVLMLSITEHHLHSPVMTNVLIRMLHDYLPTRQDFVINNVQKLVGAHGGVRLFSLGMLLFSSSGVFLPLEVALNQVWFIPENRSYLANQIVSLALALGCGALAMLSVAATAGNHYMLHSFLGEHADNFLIHGIEFVVMKAFALLAGILVFLAIFYVLPNGRVPFKPVFLAAVVTGISWEACKYLYILCLPLLDFQQAYGPFSTSVTMIFWAFLSGLLLLGGAHLSAASRRRAD